MNLLYTIVKNFPYLGSRIRHDNWGRGHSYAYRIYLTNRRPRINAAPKKGYSTFTRGSYRKTWHDLVIRVIYTIQTITVQYNSILAKKYDIGTLNVYLPVLHNIHK